MDRTALLWHELNSVRVWSKNWGLLQGKDSRRKVIKEFDVNVVISEYLKIYKNLLENKNEC
jgi:hypothetical protein